MKRSVLIILLILLAVTTVFVDDFDRFINAVENGNADNVKHYISPNADMNKKNNLEKTALFYVKGEGHIERVDFLVQAVANEEEERKYELIEAIKQADTAKVEQLIEKGTDVNNVYGEKKRTAIMIAADTGNQEIVMLLMNAGADIDKPDKDGKIPLAYAAGKGHIELVKLFLKQLKKHNPDYRFAPYCYQALVEAAAKGNREIVEFLLHTISEIQDPHYNSIKGIGALDAAIENGHLETVKLLVEKGALEPRKYFNYPTDLFRGAVENDHTDVLEYLFKKIMTEKALQQSGAFLLHYAAESAQDKVIRFLIKRGVNVNCRFGEEFPEGGVTALMTAAEKGHKQTVELLISLEADVNAIDNQGRKAVDHARGAGHHEIVKLLLKAGTRDDADLREELMHAVYENDIKKVRRLIKQGVDVNAADILDRSALIRAIKKGYTDIAELLIAAGADVNTKNSDGYTILMLAIFKEQPELVRLIIQAGADIDEHRENHNTALMYAVSKGNREMVKMLLNAGAEVNSTGFHDTTALILAIEYGHKYIIKLLIQNGADVDIMDDGGKRPIEYAREKNYQDIVDLLQKAEAKDDAEQRKELLNAVSRGEVDKVKQYIDQGADINARDEYGRSCLIIASMKNYKEMVIILIQAGCELNYRDGHGMRANDYAYANHFKDIVDLLRRAGAEE